MPRAEIVSNLAVLAERKFESDHYSIAPESYKIIDQTEILAVEEGSLYIESRHLLLALMDDERGIAKLQGTGVAWLDLKEELERVGKLVRIADQRAHPFPIPTRSLMNCFNEAKYPSRVRGNHIIFQEDLYYGTMVHSYNNAARTLRRQQGSNDLNDQELLFEN